MFFSLVLVYTYLLFRAGVFTENEIYSGNNNV